jgi:RHS repeat-associated protein
LTAKTDAANKAVTYTYWGNGKLKSRTWARGGTTNYTYVGAYYGGSGANSGELHTVDYPDGGISDVSYTYDRAGLVYTINDAAGTHTFSYTNLLPTSETISGSFYAQPVTLNSSYDSFGRKAGLDVIKSGQNIFSVDYAYDETTGRFSAVNTGGGNGFHYGYKSGTDMVETIKYPTTSGSTLTTTRTFNTPSESRLLLTRVENKVNGNILSQYNYAYGERGERISVETTGEVEAWGNQLRHNLFRYNDRLEITNSIPKQGSVSNPGLPVVSEYREYAYDPIGNRSTYQEAAQTATTYTTNNLNQYGGTSYPTEEFLYDLDGNMISTGTTTHSFNIENRLEMVSPKKQYPIDYDKKVEYTYDYKGRRISRKVWTYYSSAWSQTPTEYTKYVWDGWLLIAELDGNNSDAVLSTYTWGLDLSGTMEGAGGIGGLLAASKKTGTSIDLGYLYDGNGNVTQLFDLSDGSEEGHYEYDPFGKEIVASGNQCEWNKFRFSTKYLEDVVIDASKESELGLYYYGYRYYSPRLGRWINRDPIGEIESLNLLFFCKNEPNNYIDILGNSFKDWLPVIGVYISLNKSLRGEVEFDYLECVKCTVPKNDPAAHLVGTDEHSCLECMKDLRWEFWRKEVFGEGSPGPAKFGLDIIITGVGGGVFTRKMLRAALIKGVSAGSVPLLGVLDAAASIDVYVQWYQRIESASLIAEKWCAYLN